MRRLVLTALLAGVVLSACAGNALAAKDLVGQVREYELAPGTRPEALVSGPDGNLWFGGVRYLGGGNFASVAGKVGLSGQVSEYTVATQAANVGIGDIAVGPDGNLWFTEGGFAKVGRITTAGAVTEFDLPDPAARPASIVAGPDGNLWFSEWQGGKVGRITPAGQVAEFPLPGGGASGIAVGPDGYLWLTQATTIARVATDGTSTPFPLPPSIEYPGEIVAGPDGALWFGLQSRFGLDATPGLGRIATDGGVSQVPVPGGRQTFALSSGPYENLWYSNGGGRIGWIIPGVVTGDPACISSCQAPIADLAEGPDGKLWFAAGVDGNAPFSDPGTVGTYAPPPVEVKILGDARLRGGKLLLPVRCRLTPAGSRCKGRARLLNGYQLDERPLNLRIGDRRRVAMQLPDQVLRQLAAGRRIVIRATTTVAGGRPDKRRIVLRRP